jgi:hypothetical protein
LGEIDGENVRDIRVLAELPLENGTGKKTQRTANLFCRTGIQQAAETRPFHPISGAPSPDDKEAEEDGAATPTWNSNMDIAFS